MSSNAQYKFSVAPGMFMRRFALYQIFETTCQILLLTVLCHRGFSNCWTFWKIAMSMLHTAICVFVSAIFPFKTICDATNYG